MNNAALTEQIEAMRTKLLDMAVTIRQSVDAPFYNKREQYAGQHSEMRDKTREAAEFIEEARNNIDKVLEAMHAKENGNE